MFKISEIETTETTDPVYASINAKFRNIEAIDEYKGFFMDPEHIDKVDRVKEIVDSFFKVKKAIYINQRPNGGKPMTVIKVEDPIFPNSMKRADRERLYYKPLEDLGVKLVYAKGTKSWLHRIS